MRFSFPAHVPSESATSENRADKWATASLVKQSRAGLMADADVTGKQLVVVSAEIVVRGGRECSYSEVQSTVLNLTLENGR